MARSLVGRALVELGGDPEYRQGVLTDNGNLILDVHGMSITDPKGLELAINQIPGVVTCGLFAKRPADTLLLASDTDILELLTRRLMTTSFDKSKLKVLLLEGIHPSAERIFRDTGYTNIEAVKTALTGEELRAKLEGVHFLGIRSRTTLTRNILKPPISWLQSGVIASVQTKWISRLRPSKASSFSMLRTQIRALLLSSFWQKQFCCFEVSQKRTQKHIAVAGQRLRMTHLRFAVRHSVSLVMDLSDPNCQYLLRALVCA